VSVSGSRSQAHRRGGRSARASLARQPSEANSPGNTSIELSEDRSAASFGRVQIIVVKETKAMEGLDYLVGEFQNRSNLVVNGRIE